MTKLQRRGVVGRPPRRRRRRGPHGVPSSTVQPTDYDGAAARGVPGPARAARARRPPRRAGRPGRSTTSWRSRPGSSARCGPASCRCRCRRCSRRASWRPSSPTPAPASVVLSSALRRLRRRASPRPIAELRHAVVDRRRRRRRADPDPRVGRRSTTSARRRSPRTGADSPAFWLYSSGTTGVPKGVMHRHGSPQATAETYARDGARHRPRRPLPVGGQAVLRLRPRQLADVPALGRRRRHPQPAAADAARRRSPSSAPSSRRCSSPAPASSPRCSTPTCRLTRSRRCGRPSPPARRCRPTCSAASRSASGTRCSTASARPRRCTSSCPTARAPSVPARAARPVPGLRGAARRRGRAGSSSTPDTPGYLQVRGPSLATGYWSRDAATRAAFQGEWLATGDVYTRSADGYWTFLGRNSDMIKAGGIWVSPAEVEAVLVEHPDVLEAAVVGARDAAGLEITVAFLVARQGRTIDDGAIDAHCRARMAAFKRPRRVLHRRRAAEDGDRQDPPVRPPRAAGGRAGRRRAGLTGSMADLVDVGGGALEASLVDADDPADDRPPLVFLHEGLGSLGLLARRSPSRSVRRSADRAMLVYSRHGYGRSAPARLPRPVTLHAPRGRRRAAGAAGPLRHRAAGPRRPQRRRLDRPAVRRCRSPGRPARAPGPARVRRGRQRRRHRRRPHGLRHDRPAGAPGPPPRRRRRHVPRLERRVALAGVPVVEHRGPPGAASRARCSSCREPTTRTARPPSSMPSRRGPPGPRSACCSPLSATPRTSRRPEATLDAIAGFLAASSIPCPPDLGADGLIRPSGRAESRNGTLRAQIAGPGASERVRCAHGRRNAARTRSPRSASRSTRSLLNTKRTWRSATSPPQPRIGVAATRWSSSRSETSTQSSPRAATSRSSDQPPAGRTTGSPSSWRSVSSRRRSYSAFGREPRGRRARRGRRGPRPGQTRSPRGRCRCGRATTSLTSAPGATTQPMRQAIMRCSNAVPPTVTVRSRMPASAAGWRIGRPSKRTASNPAQ